MNKLMRIVCMLLAAVLFCLPFSVFAEEDPYDETEPEYSQTFNDTAADTTAPHGDLTRETTKRETTTAQPKKIDPPLVKISRENLSRKPKAGETFTLTVVFHNYSGDVSLRSGLASFETSEGLVLLENSASKVVPVISPSGVRSVQIRLRVAKDAAAAAQSVSVAYAYSYNTPEGLVQAEASEKLLLTVVTADSTSESGAAASAATPNIIVSNYNYGGTIAAGDTFTLSLQFTNTSKKIAAENIVMSVDAGDGVSITSASNTYYYASLGASQSRSQSIPMRVAANAGSEGARIDISFRYEYVSGGSRSEASASERLSIPIYTPDRFSVSVPDTQLIGIQNEELSVSLPYVNKSRSSVDNVSAELLYDESAVSCEQPRINLGNFEPGKSGTIDFYFTPLESGDGTVTVKITYEDELLQEKSMEIAVPYSVDEAYTDFGMEEPMDFPEEETANHTWIYVVCSVAAAVVILIVVLVVHKKRKKKKSEPQIDFDWAPSNEVGSHEDQ